jgi:hypothetical protein
MTWNGRYWITWSWPALDHLRWAAADSSKVASTPGIVMLKVCGFALATGPYATHRYRRGGRLRNPSDASRSMVNVLVQSRCEASVYHGGP